ncbi:ornithine cyclodeaminase/mu-crystallin family protein [Histoplasma capsulatum G186AR]|uniref:Ornithine cyclodeaminase/mu-crystallin family protein n=2 Tax=Ajellomyces capsulatus TaxID=5037 RepID=C0P1A9_AJECG|nr:ornithine cyclodeaminase/mu-crystallin family protein [Histoplasma capsulatum G186AR]EEH02568.1 ornithine cyclodeaminase/mu-crystallin family protein [Histoplasma capsulatum G186AR]KAG5305528.1 ornithine cyclodeaminase/mu-crystallin family protein [Histoplasma capsulatum]QSS76490.1 ornithine cyclodeaminase/mu-crystallin family protein [Histoplasma capsulatum G186AR]
MLILRDTDISPILQGLTVEDCRRLLHCLWKALATYSKENSYPGSPKLLHQPIRETIVTNLQHTTLFMPASDTNTTTGIKVVTLPGGGGTAQGAINIFSPKGELQGLLNAQQITAFRTALASMLPLLHHRLPERASIVIFGAGKQAEWHIRLSLLLLAGKIVTVTVVSRSRETLETFDNTLLAELRNKFPQITFRTISNGEPNSDLQLRNVLAASDAIFCCTPSTQPLFPDAYLRYGNEIEHKIRFISLIGSYKPHMEEIDSATLLSGTKILVDSKEACLEEAGELINAKVQKNQLVEVGELPFPFDVSDGTEVPLWRGNTIFKCVGMGIMDIAISRELLRVASGKGIGIQIESF